MKQRILLLLLFAFSLSVFSQEASSVDFVIKNLGLDVDGHFKTFVIDAELDTDNKLKNLSSTVEIASINTGIEARDEHLQEEDYFNANEYASIILKSTDIAEDSNGNYRVKANLTIKGKTKEIAIMVGFQLKGNDYKITSNFEINRKDFNVGGGSFIMSKTVRIKVVHFQKMQ